MARWFATVLIALVIQGCGGAAPPMPVPASVIGSPLSGHGHEVLTSEAATNKELSPTCAPRSCPYARFAEPIRSAILGVRWADLMGYPVVRQFECWNAVAQENEDVQYDHALRRFADQGTEGGMRALIQIRARLRQRFVTAASAEDTIVDVVDGDALIRNRRRARLPYFLLGRALHIVQDSFSTYHTTRSADFRTLQQVRSYVCTPEAPVHPHSDLWDLIENVVNEDASNGDLISLPNCNYSKMSKACLKPEYRAAVEASNELWAAFERVRSMPPDARESSARAAVNELLEQWFKLPDSVPASNEVLPEKCPKVDETPKIRNQCLLKTGVGEPGEPPLAW